MFPPQGAVTFCHGCGSVSAVAVEALSQNPSREDLAETDAEMEPEHGGTSPEPGWGLERVEVLLRPEQICGTIQRAWAQWDTVRDGREE